MPAASTTLRVLAASVIASLTVTGCQALDDAGAAMGRADLVNDLAARLDRALELTYSADYQLPGGRDRLDRAGAGAGSRSAYTWPGGKLTVTPEAITRCATTGGRTACTLIAPPAPGGKPSVVVFAEANRHGLVTPPVVIRLLTAAALDPEATIDAERHHGRRAPRHLRGRQPRSATASTACVTTEGVLGSFTGTARRQAGGPGAEPLHRERWTARAFDVPAGAGRGRPPAAAAP